MKFIILLSPLLLAWVWLSPSYVRGMQNYDIKRLLLIVLAMGAGCHRHAPAVGILFVGIRGAEPQGPLDLFIDSLGYVFDPNHINPETGELGRVTTLFFWASNGDHHGLSNLLFGYGLNTTNHGSTMPGFLNPCSTCCWTPPRSASCCGKSAVGAALFIGLVGLLLWCCRPRPCSFGTA